MAQWVRLCGAGETPPNNSVMELEAGGISICLANVNGELAALDNVCPHRLGPLGQGWVEGGAVVCPWHAWCFDPKTGAAVYPDRGQVEVFPLRIEENSVLVELPEEAPMSGHRTSEEALEENL